MDKQSRQIFSEFASRVKEIEHKNKEMHSNLNHASKVIKDNFELMLKTKNISQTTIPNTGGAQDNMDEPVTNNHEVNHQTMNEGESMQNANYSELNYLLYSEFNLMLSNLISEINSNLELEAKKHYFQQIYEDRIWANREKVQQNIDIISTLQENLNNKECELTGLLNEYQKSVRPLRENSGMHFMFFNMPTKYSIELNNEFYTILDSLEKLKAMLDAKAVEKQNAVLHYNQLKERNNLNLPCLDDSVVTYCGKNIVVQRLNKNSSISTALSEKHINYLDDPDLDKSEEEEEEEVTQMNLESIRFTDMNEQKLRKDVEKKPTGKKLNICPVSDLKPKSLDFSAIHEQNKENIIIKSISLKNASKPKYEEKRVNAIVTVDQENCKKLKIQKDQLDAVLLQKKVQLDKLTGKLKVSKCKLYSIKDAIQSANFKLNKLDKALEESGAKPLI